VDLRAPRKNFFSDLNAVKLPELQIADLDLTLEESRI
jgi:hypothetical protein